MLLLACGQAWSSDEGTYRTISDSIGPFLVAGELALAADGKAGRREAEQTAKALAVTAIATEALKMITHVERPDGGSYDSFPSGHTSAAFAMATAVADYQPQYKWTAYTMAAAIGYSRIEVNAHRWDEVVAGAILGHCIAKQFTKTRNISATPVAVSIRF
jgi:membrane-associated phospholipid phosphatase